MIYETDECPHPVGDEPAWSESYYFAFFGDGVSGVSRIGNRPNEGTQDALLVLFEDEAVTLIRAARPSTENTDELSVGGLEYTCVNPLKQWKIRYRGPAVRFEQPRALLGEPGEPTRVEVDIDLDFHAAHAPGELEYDERISREVLERVAAHHFEQSGIVEGTVLGKPFSGRGHRDKSWGVRDWSAPEMWRWFALDFDESFAMNASIVRVDGQEIRTGWAWHKDALHPVRDVALDTEFGPDGHSQKSLVLQVTIDGEPLRVEGVIESIAPLPFPMPDGRAMVVNEALATFRLPDGRTCRGIAEYLQPLDPSCHEALLRGYALQYDTPAKENR
ncbi:MAG TPA: hypothetical protein VIW24_29805 [Aldersonia sp.]